MSEQDQDRELARRTIARARALKLQQYADVVADVNSFVWAFDREDDGEEGRRWDRWTDTLPAIERELREAAREAREQGGARVGVGHVLAEGHDGATCEVCG